MIGFADEIHPFITRHCEAGHLSEPRQSTGDEKPPFCLNPDLPAGRQVFRIIELAGCLNNPIIC